MQSPTALVFFALAIVSSADALTPQVGPGKMAKFANDPTFTQANFAKLGLYRSGAKDRRITHIEFYKTPGVDKSGVYSVSLTLHDLAPTYGGSSAGGQFVVLGKYDMNKTPHTFTPNKEAVALNNTTNGDCTNLMVEPRDAICCGVDQKDGIYFVIRSSLTAPFPKPVRVTTAVGTAKLPRGFYVQAVPCFVEGILVMIYTDKGHQIIMRQLELQFDANNKFKGAELQRVNIIAKSTNRPHSPAPVIDAAGNVRGLWFGIAKGSDSDMFFQPGITLKDQAIRVFDDASTMSGGGICGGRLFFVENGVVVSGDTAWLAGSITDVDSHGTATITVGARNAKRPLKNCPTHLAFSARDNAGVHAGVTVPGFHGMFALNSPVFVFTTVSSTTVEEMASWSTKVPKLASLKGLRTSIQGLATPQGGKPTLTNTATLEFR